MNLIYHEPTDKQLTLKTYNKMLIISAREFRANQKKYLDQVDEGVEIIITRAGNKSYKITREIDNDLVNAITAEELLVGIEDDIKSMFKRKKDEKEIDLNKTT